MPNITCASIARMGEYRTGVVPTVLTVMAGAALGGGIAVGATVIVIAAVIALVLLAGANGLRALQQLFDKPGFRLSLGGEAAGLGPAHRHAHVRARGDHQAVAVAGGDLARVVDPERAVALEDQRRPARLA